MSLTGLGESWAYSFQKHRTPTAILGLALAVMLIAALVPHGSAAAASEPPAVLFPKQGAYLGSWVKPRSGETRQAAIQRVEGQIGRKFTIDHQYYQWNAAIPTSYEAWDVSQGRIPFINWKMPAPWSTVTSGSQDSWIAARADAFKAFGSPVYLAIHHEPENDMAQYGSKADFIAGFRHIVDIFRSRGVTNVAFSWTMMSWSFDVRSGQNIDQWYPGDAYVDLIGVDGYNWAPGRAGSKWTMFGTVFDPANKFAAAHGKPWMAVEYGTQEDPSSPARKGDWLKDALATTKGWPLLKGLIYFDENKLYPWQTDSSGQSMAAYGVVANDKYLDPSTAPPPTTVPPTTAPPTTVPPTTAPPTTGPPTTGPPTTVPPTTPPPTTEPPPTGVSQIANSLDGGIAGVPLTPTNGGGGGAPFDRVDIESSSSLTYDGTGGRVPGLAAKHVLGVGDNAYYEWDHSFGWAPTWYGRVYVKFDANPGGDLRLIRAKRGDSPRLVIVVLRNGYLRVKDLNNNTIGTMSNEIALGSWVRIEWMVNDATGTVALELFNNANSTTPTETLQASGQNIGDAANRLQIGRLGHQSFSATFWTDDPALSTRGFPGPA
jgi:hypothetical protein